MKMCEACGGEADGGCAFTAWLVAPDYNDCDGAPLCDNCADRVGYKGATSEDRQRSLGARIRSRRAASEAGPRDHNGDPLMVGDRVTSMYRSPSEIGIITKVYPNKAWAKWDGSNDESWDEGGAWTKLITPAQGEASGEATEEWPLCWSCGLRIKGSAGCGCAHKTTGGYAADGEASGCAGKADDAAHDWDHGTEECRHCGKPREFSERFPPPDPSLLHFGPDTYPANPSYAIARQPDNEPPVVARNESYESFRAAVETHLVPRLPRGLKVVTDLVTLKNPPSGDDGARLAVWVLRKNGKEVLPEKLWCFSTDRREAKRFPFRLKEMANTIASALMAERARVGK